jgi:hypothetical protein
MRRATARRCWLTSSKRPRRPATPTPGGLPGELADVLEVLRALTVTAGMSWAQLLALADDKRSRRGGFRRRIFLESVE